MKLLIAFALILLVVAECGHMVEAGQRIDKEYNKVKNLPGSHKVLK